MEQNINSQETQAGPAVQGLVERVKSFVSRLPKNQNLVVFVAVILVGVLAGFVLSNRSSRVAGTGTAAPGTLVSQTEAGLEDATFKDTATGLLETGGVDGEGTHHLTREGGESQNVYLTSTVINLDSFVGKKVQIWGQTIAAQKAGWLMDVGKLKIVD